MKIIVVALVFTILASIVDSREIYGLKPNLRNGIEKSIEMSYHGNSEEYGDSEENGEVTEPNFEEEEQGENGLTTDEKDFWKKTFLEYVHLMEFLKNSEISEENDDNDDNDEYGDGEENGDSEESGEVIELNSEGKEQEENGLASDENDFWKKTFLEYVNLLEFLKDAEISEENGEVTELDSEEE